MERKKSYRFISDLEPSDKQLHYIMKEVACDSKKKAEETNAKFQQDLNQLSLVTRKQHGAVWKF